MQNKILYSKASPFRMLLAGYLFFILAGMILLSLPAATKAEAPASLVDIFFTTVSAVTTSGLVVLETPEYFSVFGQMVILVLIQICGLGYMIFVSFIILAIGRKITMGNMMLLKENVTSPTYGDAFYFMKIAVIFTVIFEVVAAAVFFTVFRAEYSGLEAAYHAVFQAVSAFCTAGFTTLPDNFKVFADNSGLLFFGALISISGGIGFFVLFDLYSFAKERIKGKKTVHLTVHSKFVIALTLIVTVMGTLLLFVDGFRVLDMSYNRLVQAFFHTVMAMTTTGFNSVDITAVSDSGKTILMMLMFIGAAPGGTASGIKVVTVGILFMTFLSVITKKNSVNVFEREISSGEIKRAVSIVFSGVMFIMITTYAVTALETKVFMDVLFDSVAAYTNGGLSVGAAGKTSDGGKIIMSLAMLMGRMGSLAIGFSLLGRVKKESVKFPDAGIIIG
ncbi:MAG: TrkH family potassium uptake protein [Candidatus Goldiibacteriota bacterium]